MENSQNKVAKLYRMVMDKHVCPYGIKSKWLLERRGYTVEDHHLTTREQTDAFKLDHGVETTPQSFIGGKRIGGYTELRAIHCQIRTVLPIGLFWRCLPRRWRWHWRSASSFMGCR